MRACEVELLELLGIVESRPIGSDSEELRCSICKSSCFGHQSRFLPATMVHRALAGRRFAMRVRGEFVHFEELLLLVPTLYEGNNHQANR